MYWDRKFRNLTYWMLRSGIRSIRVVRIRYEFEIAKANRKNHLRRKRCNKCSASLSPRMERLDVGTVGSFDISEAASRRKGNHKLRQNTSSKTNRMAHVGHQANNLWMALWTVDRSGCFWMCYVLTRRVEMKHTISMLRTTRGISSKIHGEAEIFPDW